MGHCLGIFLPQGIRSRVDLIISKLDRGSRRWKNTTGMEAAQDDFGSRASEGGHSPICSTQRPCRWDLPRSTRIGSPPRLKTGSESCKINHQNRADNALLRKLKVSVQKLKAAIEATISTLASATETIGRISSRSNTACCASEDGGKKQASM